ncbi:hypothetical protein OKW40_005502 [Paraburkholderia sp. RAU6.4a]
MGAYLPRFRFTTVSRSRRCTRSAKAGNVANNRSYGFGLSYAQGPPTDSVLSHATLNTLPPSSTNTRVAVTVGMPHAF